MSAIDRSPRPRWWTTLPAGLAPVALIGGWTWAASRQPHGYNAVRATISALAGHGATDRWIMTTGLATLGASYLLTAAGLTPARPAGRLLLAAGGAASLAVAAFPQPATGSSRAHIAAAGVAFVCLTAWPAFAARADAPTANLLNPRSSIAASAVLAGLLIWLRVELAADGDMVGLSERALAGAQSLWPLAVVISARSMRRREPSA